LPPVREPIANRVQANPGVHQQFLVLGELDGVEAAEPRLVQANDDLDLPGPFSGGNIVQHPEKGVAFVGSAAAGFPFIDVVFPDAVLPSAPTPDLGTLVGDGGGLVVLRHAEVEEGVDKAVRVRGRPGRM
jgi:hypothetical protein